jgi:L-lactate dehydrogenase complex protein LldG
MNADPQRMQDFLRDLAARVPHPVSAAGGSGWGTEPTTDLREVAGVPHPVSAKGGSGWGTEPTTDLREVAAGDDLVARFCTSAESAGCRVYRSNDHDWLAVVRRIMGDHAAHTVLIEPQPGTALSTQRAAALGAALEADGIATTDERTDEVLFSVDVGITGVLGAVAETGTLMCASSATAARGATLIPPIHIALVAESQIVGDLFDLFAQLGAGPDLPAAVSLITGPSKTADIEGVLVTGVHGPGEVHIVIV